MNENNASPILIYQMGKVGSKTVEATLKQLGLPNRIYHAHFLSWSGIEEVERYYAACGQPRRLDHSRKIREFLDNNPTLRCKVITLVRDWAGRELSNLFEKMEVLLPDAVEETPPEKAFHLAEAYLENSFASFNVADDNACTWFDKELKDVFGFDIFSVPFDAQRGYQIYSTARADILCIRLEDLSRVYQAAFRDFLGVSVPQLVIDNEGSDKQSREIYQQIKQQFRVPESVLGPIYQSRLMRHFYTEDEIARFKAKWLKATPTTEHSLQTGRILMIHSEGNINNNPNLSGLVEILCEQGYQVDIASPRRKGIPQKSPHPSARLLLVDNKQAKVAGELVLLAGKPLSTAQEIAAAVGAIESYDFIFGVDRAIIEASIIAHARTIPYGLISYEIFFAEEAGADYKEPEIAACRDIAFAVCQDPVRGGCLSRENRIPPDKMIYIPVAGRGIVPRQKSCALHQKLGIDPSKKIAIYCGSVEAYCMIDELIQSVAAWPDDWVLVIHNRYGLDRTMRSYYQKYLNTRKVVFSTEPVDSTDQMHTLLNSADIGVAMYKPVKGNKWQGNNIAHIGMASGKISTYLQHGLPVLINELGQISDCVRQYHLGQVHSGPMPIAVPQTTELARWGRNGQAFFAEHLDLNQTSRPLLERLSQAVCRKCRPVACACSRTVDSYPKITVVTPSYNQAAYLEACIQSVLSQNYPNLEYIIMDGGSTDGSVEIIKKYEQHLAYWQSRPDGGQYQAVQEGFRRSTGQIMTWLNSDDILHPGSLQCAAAIFGARPEVQWIMGRPNSIDSQGRMRHQWKSLPLWSREKYLRRQYRNPFIQQEGTFWTRSLWDKAGGCLDLQYRLAGDMELWARFFRLTQLTSVDVLLGAFRHHDGQKTQTDMERYLAEAESIINREIEHYNASIDKRLLPAPTPILQDELKTLLAVAPVVTSVDAPAGYLVSAIVSTYNSEAFIRGCLQDLVEQTLYQKGQLEIVVVNSGSEENEEAIVKEYQARYRHIQYIKTAERETIYAAWNRGIRAARGRYITNANTDDRHAPDMMEKQATALEQNPDAAGVYSYFCVTHTPNQTWQNKTVVKVETWHPAYSHDNLLKGNFMGPFPMWRRSLHDEYGWFDPALKVAGDYEFFLRVSQTHPMLLIPEPLGLYYYNPSSLERSAGTRDREDQWIKQLYRESRGRVIRRPFYPAEEARSNPESVREHLLAGAIKLFQKAQKAFAAGNMLTARRVMAQYQAVMNYDHLPRIDRRHPSGSPLMSVIIVTYQRSDDVAKLLDCFRRQTDRDFETIVVDNGGTDIAGITDKADCIIPCPINFNLSEGRNIGAWFARGKIAVFVDDDALVEADYTASVRQAFQTYQVLGLRGRTLPKTSVSNKHIAICDRGDKPFPTLCNQEGNSAFLLWAWRTVGGQDPLLFGHEGTDITWRMIHAFGRQDVVMYWPETVIYHDYGDGGKTRRKRRQQDINQDYLLYKYDQSISDIRSQLETLPLTEGNALFMQPPASADAKCWHSLCYQDNLHTVGTVPSPKVAVVIACQNMAEYLPQCLDGIRAQTLKEWETLIVDDGSTDGSREILQRYAQLDKRFRLFFFDKSEGPYVRRNFAIEHARAPFISIQDADDILAPQKLEMLLEEILRDDSLGVVGSFFGRFIDAFRGPEYCDRIRLQVSHDEIVKGYQRSFYVCWHASAIIRKTLFEQVGLYDCQPWGSDTFWLAKAAMYGILTGRVRFKNLPEMLTYKREHKKSQTGTILLNHPNGRRKVLSRYGQQKLMEIAQKARENPGFDVGQAIRNCNCNDFIPRFGHLFEQWESGAVTQQMIAGLLSKAMHEFCSGYCSDSLISLNSLCDVCKGAEKQIQGLNLLRGLCQFIAGEDEFALLSLRQEYADHGTVQARDFLNRYLTQTDTRPGGVQRREIVDRFVFTDRPESPVKVEVLYDNRHTAVPRVSVILDCRRGTVDLEAVLAEWTAQTQQNFELLILTAGNSKADFADQTLPLRSAVLNFEQDAVGAAVKNRAVSFARGEILLFIRWHIAVRTDCIATVQEALNTPAIGAVSGRIVSASGGWNTNLDYGDRKLFCCLDQDMLCAVKRDVFERAGGLDEGLWGREMLSLSWAIYDGADTDFGSILYVPGLAGTWRADVPMTTDYVLRQLATDQLYWRRSCPGKYWGFVAFAERCFWADDASGQCDPDQAGQIVQFFAGKHRAIALQWARLAYRLKPDRLGELYVLANCEWDAGNIEQGARYYQQVLAVPFMRKIESGVLSPAERGKVSEIIHCYVTAALKLAQYHQERGQIDMVRRMLEQLKSNPNCVLDAQQLKQFDSLYRQAQTTESKQVPALTASRSRRPQVSVIMPAYNSAAYIDAAIQSVLAQTYPDFELIIVNDGSTDQTEHVIHTYRDSRIRCFSQANAGLAATRNAAIRHSVGQFIVPLDDDDRMKPEFIARHVAAFDRHPEADLIYCDDHLVDEAGRSLRVIRRKEVSNQTELISGLFQGGFPFIPFRTCIRRSVFDRIGMYDESLRVAEDYDMMRRFAAQGLIARHLTGDFYIRCVRTDSLSRNHTRTKAQIHFGVIRQFIETFSWEQLFPDANWNGLAPTHREFQGRYLSAHVFQAIGRNYMQNHTPGFYVETAIDFAIEQLERCLELSPDNPDVIRKINECRQRKSQCMAPVTV